MASYKARRELAILENRDPNLIAALDKMIAGLTNPPPETKIGAVKPGAPQRTLSKGEQLTALLNLQAARKRLTDEERLVLDSDPSTCQFEEVRPRQSREEALLAALVRLFPSVTPDPDGSMLAVTAEEDDPILDSDPTTVLVGTPQQRDSKEGELLAGLIDSIEPGADAADLASAVIVTMRQYIHEGFDVERAIALELDALALAGVPERTVQSIRNRLVNGDEPDLINITMMTLRQYIIDGFDAEQVVEILFKLGAAGGVPNSTLHRIRDGLLEGGD